MKQKTPNQAVKLKPKAGAKKADGTAYLPPKLRVWWVPQVPMPAFYTEVKDVNEAIFLLTALANYDIFQYEQKVKGDYCNAGGLQVTEDGEWVEWVNEDDYGIDEVMREIEEANG